VNITERIKICGQNISEEYFARLFERVYLEEKNLSFFEILTCMAFLCFCESQVDIAIVEVGIGGALDSTNVIEPPLVCIISSIAIDHVNYLGTDEISIARQKAGIVKKGSVCVCPVMEKKIMEVLKSEAEQRGGKIFFTENLFSVKKCDWEKGFMIFLRNGKECVYNALGDYQSLNVSCVVSGLEILRKNGFNRLDEEVVRKGFASVNLPARLQVIKKGGRNFIIDGLHNLAAARTFASNFKKSPFFGKDCRFVCAILSDKDYISMLKVFAELTNKFCFTKVSSPRALSPWNLADAMAKINPDADIEVNEDVESVLSSFSFEETMVIVGSFYLAGEAIKLLNEEKIFLRGFNDSNRS